MVHSLSIRKILMLLCCTGLIFAQTAAVSFADTSDTEVYVNKPGTTIDFSVTDKIVMTGNANSVDLTVDDLVVSNNNNIGVINIDKITVTAVSGWTLKDSATEWANLDADAQTFGLIADGNYDLGSGVYENAGEVKPGETDVTSLAGKTGMSTVELSDVKAADIVVTVSLLQSE